MNKIAFVLSFVAVTFTLVVLIYMPKEELFTRVDKFEYVLQEYRGVNMDLNGDGLCVNEVANNPLDTSLVYLIPILLVLNTYLEYRAVVKRAAKRENELRKGEKII